MDRMTFAGQFRVFIRLFWSPEAAFSELGGTGAFLLPLVVLSIAGVALQFLSLPYIERVTLSNMPAGLDPEQLQRGLHLLRMSQWAKMIVSPLLHLIRWLCVAGLVFLVLQLAGGEMSYKQCFSVVAFSSIFLSLEACLAVGIMGLKGIENVKTPSDLSPAMGLNLLFPIAGVVLNSFLNDFNLFEIWYVVVLTVGVACLNRFSRRRAALVVIPVWLFTVGVQVAFTALGSLLQPKG